MRMRKLFGGANAEPAEVDPERVVETTAELLAAADALVGAGRVVDAVDRLQGGNRNHRDPALEIRLVQLRQDAARAFTNGASRSPWPPAYDDPFPEVAQRLPEVDIDKLTAEVMGGAVAHHGALIVRGMLGEQAVARALDAIGRAETQRERSEATASGPDASDASGDASWYLPFPDEGGARTRNRVGVRGGVWLADSPASTALVLDMLTDAGVIGAVADHLGERPFFSLQKSTLRHLRPVNNLTGWHQDGSFLGPDVRTMNVWVALTACGSDRPTPSLEVVPKRVDEILSTEGGMVSIAVDPGLVDNVAADAPPIRPDFEPGDGLVFDERFLHRTYLDGDMTDDRYAIECWLFAPSHSSPKYLPFLV